jgi:hypothetical protein
MIEWKGRRRARRDVIRELHASGGEVADIARRLGVSYQTVYTVVQSGPTNASPPALTSGSKSAQMRVLFAEGNSVSDVSRALNVRYAFAYGVAQRAGYVGTGATRQGRSDGKSVRHHTKTEGVAGAPRPAQGDADAMLIGCVSQKADRPLPARDLYVSELFRRRRAYADASGVPWWILSAEYGLVEQETVIAPYDTKIAERPLAERRELASGVARGLERALGSLGGKRIEIHAGDEYVQTVGPTLRAAGAEIVRPLEGLGFGYQLQWYGDRLGWTSAPATVRPPKARASMPSSTAIGDGRGLGRRITDVFMSGGLDLSDRPGAPTPGLPEIVAMKRLRSLGADDQAIRLVLTFNAAMERARDADRLALAVVRLYVDEPWAYDPATVIGRPVRELADALRKSGVSQRHSADAYGWRLLAETLADGSIAHAARAAIYDGRADARDLLAELEGTSGGGSPLFPLLGGPKIGPLWIRLLAYPGRAVITSLEAVPIAVDVQVRKVTENLGVTDSKGMDLEAVRGAIQETWARDVALHGADGPGDLEGTPSALDPALWFYAKWGCSFCQKAGHQMPISPVCAECRFDRS